MAETIIQEVEVNLKAIEQEIYRRHCKAACEEMAMWLEYIDKALAENRDKEQLRHKGGRATTMKTLMGEVRYSRVIYEVVDDSGEKKFIYLLDEALGFDTIGLFSSNFAEKVADEATATSYKNAAKHVSEMTGQTISHGGAWKLIQKLGERAEEIEKKEKELYEAEKPTGTREVNVLFEEADGVIIKMQGEDRKAGKNQEMKVAIFYEGWKKEARKRYRLYNKRVVCGGFEHIADFGKRTEAKIASIYDLKKIKRRLFNSDGADGLREMNEADVIKQLDAFHVRQAIVRVTRDEDIRKNLSSLYIKGETKQLLKNIDAYANSMEDEKAEEKLRKLYSYFNKNEDDLLPYKSRGLDIPEPPEGLEYRSMGACEHNVYLVASQRMKRRCALWSKKGATNMGKVLALKISGKLGEVLTEVTKVQLPEGMTKDVVTAISSGKVPMREGKGYEGKTSSRPFAGASRTNGRRAIDGMFDLKSLSSAAYM